MTYYIEFYDLMEWGNEACKKLLAMEHIDVLLELSRDQKFDVLITEYFNTDCVLGLAYKLNITSFIGMVSKTFFFFHSAFSFSFLNGLFFIWWKISQVVLSCLGITIELDCRIFLLTFPVNLSVPHHT